MSESSPGAGAKTTQGQNEVDFRHLFSSIPYPTWVYDMETLSFLEVNQKAIDCYGYSREEFLAMRITDIRPPEDLPRLLARRGETRHQVEFWSPWRHCLKDGRVIEVEITAHQVNFAGRPAALVIVRDITEGRRAAQLLEESEQRYRSLFDYHPDAIFSLDPKGRFQSANPACERLTGYTPAELVTLDFLSLVIPAEAARVGKHLQRAMRGEAQHYQSALVRRDGQTIYLDVTNVPILVQERIVGIYGVAKDITAQRQVEEALHRAKEELERRVKERTLELQVTNERLQLEIAERRRLLALSQSLLSAMTLDEVLREILQALADLLPHDSYAFYWVDEQAGVLRPVQITGTEWISPELREWEIPLDEGIIGSVALTGRGEVVNRAHEDPRVSYPPGSEVSCEHLICIPVRSKSRVIAVFRLSRFGGSPFSPVDFEVAELFIAHAAIAIENARLFEYIKASEAKYRTLFEESKDVVFISTLEGRFVEINPAGVELFGYASREEILAADVSIHYVDPQQREQLHRLMATQGSVRDFEITICRRDGALRTVLENSTVIRDEQGEVIGYRGMLHDVTARKQVEALQVRQTRQAALRADVSDALASALSLETMLQQVVGAIARHSDVRMAGIWLFDQASEALVLQAASPSHALDPSYQQLPVGQLTIGWIARDRHPFLINDLFQDGRLVKKEWMERADMRALAGYPLVVEDQLIGLLALFAASPFLEEEFEALASVANTLAQGIERKQAMEERVRLLAREQAAERRFRDLVNSLDAIVWEGTADNFRFTFVSQRAETLLGYPPGRWIEEPDFWPNLIHPEDREYALRLCQQATAAGQDHDFSYRVIAADGRVVWLRDIVYVLCDAEGKAQQLRGLMIDITDQKRAEEQRDRLLRLEQEARAESETIQARLRFLTEASDLLASALNYESALATLARLAVPAMADWCVIDIVDEKGQRQRMATAHTDPAREVLLKKVQQHYPLRANRPTLMVQTLQSGTSRLFPEVPDRLLVEAAHDEEHLCLLREIGISSIIVVPLIARGRTLGGILFALSQQERRYTERDLALAEELAQRAAIAVDNIRLYTLAQQELADRQRAEEALREANQQLTDWLSKLEQRTREISLLNEMGELLQACPSAEDTYAVISTSLARLFPEQAGALYVLSPSRILVEMVAAWGEGAPREEVFAPDNCWALRRGRPHLERARRGGLLCRHLASEPPACSLCLPLVAQGETLGVLHLGGSESYVDHLSNDQLQAMQQLAETVADHIALALANIRLRERLRAQSIRDPLTGLFNRRYMEETLERELRRAARNGHPVGVIMFDVDHFKRFNDSFGHDAGDLVLQEIGTILQEIFRTDDIPCRYGGEEFVLILPDATLEASIQRAEQLHAAIRDLRLVRGGQSLGRVTLSIGVAAFPSHGLNAQSLLQVADAALFRAKRAGRDRLMVAE